MNGHFYAMRTLTPGRAAAILRGLLASCLVAACGASWALTSSTTSLAVSPSPAAYSQTVTLTATVTGSTPSGTVTFKDGSTTLGTGTISSGKATKTISTLAVGSHSLTASYGGDSKNASSSTASATSLTVNKATSTSTLAVSPSPANFGQSVKLTATVLGASPSGTVTFKDGTTTLGTGTLASGKATLSSTTLSVGSHSLTASYAGDGNNATSASGTSSLTVNKATSTTTLAASPSPVKFGQSTTLTATIVGGSPSGTVTFKDGTSTLGTATIASGKATLSTSTLAVGSHGLSASYGGDGNNATSASTTTSLTVNTATSTTTLVAAPSPAGFGQAVTLTATVVGASPSGTVTFKDGTTTLGTGAVSSGHATYTTSALSIATHSLTASYGGDTDNGASASSTVSLIVNKATTTTTMTANPSPARFGQVVTLTATVVGDSPSGTVTFKDGTTTLGTGTVSGGQATYTTSALSIATHSLKASYGGDTNNNTSTSSAFSLVVGKAATTTSLTASPMGAPAGQAISLTATVVGSSPTGSVTFMDGSTTLGTFSISSGQMTFVTRNLAAGTHSVTASYGGDSKNATSTSTAVGVTISVATSTTSLSITPSPAFATQPVQLTAVATGATSPSGTVTFMDGSTSLGSASVVGNTATLSTSSLPAGLHSLMARYSGDANDTSSTSSTINLTVNSLPATSTAARVSLNPTSTQTPVWLGATVTGSSPTGSLSFYEGTTLLGSTTLSNGQGLVYYQFTAAGTHNVVAVYSGDSNNAGSTSSPIAEVVTAPAPTTSTLTSSATNVVTNQSVTLNATVTGSSPTGTVLFLDGGSTLGGHYFTLSSGQASLTTAFTTGGTHSLTVQYSGDTFNSPSTSSAIAVTAVPQTVTTTVLTSSLSNASTTQSLTLTAQVTGSSPTGTVTFSDGAVVLASQAVSGGGATLTTTLSPVGHHSLTAAYSGDTWNTSSNSSAVNITIADALEWNYTYDALGAQTSVLDPNLNQTTFLYDNLHRLTQTTLPPPTNGVATPILAQQSDLADHVASITDARSLSTTYTVDGLGNTEQLVSPDTGASNTTYDSLGNVLTNTDARGKTTTYTYDALNRLKTVAYSDGGTGISYGYDSGPNGKGRLASINDESGATYFAYDGFGRVLTKTQVTGPGGSQKTLVLTYTWGTTGTATGKLQTVTYPSGAIVTYGYDTAGRINDIGVTGADAIVTKVLTGLSYTALNQPNSWVWGTGAVSYQRSFDGYGRLVSYPLGNPSGTGIAAGVTRSLAFDSAGRIVGYSHSTPINWDQVFAYDGLDRLTSANLTGGNTYGYAYDASGNRIQTTINGTAYASTVSATSNWYTNVATAAGGATAQGYDLAGHLTSDAGGTYTYSGRGRLKTELRSSNTFTYLYNAMDQRVYKTGPTAIINTGNSYYAYDEAGHLVGEYDATGKAVYETVYLGDMPVAALTQPAIGQTTVSYIYADHLNTARVIVRSADQAIVWSWGSDEPFGQTQVNSNPNGLGTFVYNPRFPGQVADAESGWFYNWHRDYNPALGRYVQSDPIGLAAGSMSTYGYVDGRPLSDADPLGLLDPSNINQTVRTLISPVAEASERSPWPWVRIGAGAFVAGFETYAACHPDCDEKLKEIYEVMKVLEGRMTALYIDKYNLKNVAPTQPSPSLPKGSGSWNGHVQKIEEYRRTLQRLIQEAVDAGCLVPPFAWQLAYAPLPPSAP